MRRGGSGFPVSAGGVMARHRRALSLAAASMAVLAVVAGSGCSHITVHRKSGNPPVRETIVERHTDLLFGFYSLSPDIDLHDRCKDGWQDISTRATFWQGVLRAVTLDVYSPWTVEIACLKPKPKAPTEPF